jgi:cyclase
VIVSIDVKKSFLGSYTVYSNDGTIKTKLSPLEWSKQAEEAGAGELLITSMDQDGTWKGFDIDLIRNISNAVTIPVIANGGAGSIKDIGKVVYEGKASAVALGSMVVYQQKGMGVLVNFPDKESLKKILR